MGIADQSKLAESVSGPKDRDNDELATVQRYAHGDMTRGNEVESVCWVALMKDHLITTVSPPVQPGDQPAPVLQRQRRENRPVHDSTMPLNALLATSQQCRQPSPLPAGAAGVRGCLARTPSQVWAGGRPAGPAGKTGYGAL